VNTAFEVRNVWHPRCSSMIASFRSEAGREIASRAGADETLLIDENVANRIRAFAPGGVHHIVEVAFAANIKTDVSVLAQAGSIAVYATNTPLAQIPVWELVFLNARTFFIGSNGVPTAVRLDATNAINRALESGWQWLPIAEIVPLGDIARAHELMEHPAEAGKVIVAIQ
jgi:NADPH:quinone reductase